MSTLNDILTEDAFQTLVSSLPSSSLLVLSFHAPWAAPCAQMRTLLTTLASTYKPTDPPTISFVNLNAEDLPDISESYNVTAVPFLVLQRDGRVLESISGCDATRVRAAVEHHVGKTLSGSAAALPPKLIAERKQTDAAGAAAQTETNGHTKSSVGGSAEAGNPGTSQEELNARLASLVKAAPVMLFMKGTPSSPQCGFSRQLVAMLRERSVRYGFFNILADEDVRQGLKIWADWPTFPQLWVGGELVGGLDIVKEELENNPDFFVDYSSRKEPITPSAPEALNQSATIA